MLHIHHAKIETIKDSGDTLYYRLMTSEGVLMRDLDIVFASQSALSHF